MAARSFASALWSSVTTQTASTGSTSTEPGLYCPHLHPTNNPTMNDKLHPALTTGSSPHREQRPPTRAPGYGSCRPVESRDETAPSHRTWKTPPGPPPAFPTPPTAPTIREKRGRPTGNQNQKLAIKKVLPMSP